MTRLRRDRHSGKTLLLYPEHGLLLNDSAAAILRSCDGSTAAEIGAALRAPLDDVIAFLDALVARGLMQE
jgi:hypothetical protein